MSDDNEELEDSRPMRALLQKSLEAPKPDVQVLPEVQRKLRERSKGKFYATEWSKSPPSKVAIAAAVVMLLVALVVAWVLSPRL